MTLGELKELIAKDEGETVEVKESTGQRRDACETLCAFLNKNGGTVVFGVTKKGKLTGQLMADTTKRDLFDAFQKFEPAADIEVSYVPVDETHTAIVCHVDAGNRKPYIYDGKPHKRVQSSTTKMSQEEYERMLLARGGFRSEWEDRPNPVLSLDDLDLEAIRDTARKAVRVGRLDESIDTENAASLLDHFKLRRNGVLLNGAAVLFGKADRIDYPQLEIKMGWFKGTDQRVFLDNSHVQGNVFKLMDAAIAFCFKHLNLAAWTSGKIERDEELEIPADALREALVNAFAHRSYENRRQTIYLAIYDDRVEIKNPGSFPPKFDLTRLYSPPIQHSEPRNEKIAHVLYLRKSIETWGRGLTRIADECNRVGLPVPEVKEEYGCVTTVFKRPDWTGGNTPDQRTGIVAARTGTDTARTGTTHRLSGTAWAITGTTGTAGVEDILARLPKLRKDARANVETVLHELIADKNATIPQICARTGMALRTINNALATLRGAGILKARGNGIVGDCEGERAKKQPIKSEGQPIEGEKPHIGSRKPHIGDEKPSIEPGKPSIEDLALKYGLTRPTSENIHKLLCAFGSHIVFGRSMIMAETGVEITAAVVVLKTMLQHRLLDTVRGYGKGKYRFRTTVLS
jgi:ATP-dependent DNA helicase RecG